jgi:hypothetical protein
VDDFHKNLKLSNVNIDPQNKLDFDVVLATNLEKVFGKRTQNGCKPKPNDHLTPTNCVALLKFYDMFMFTLLIMGNIQESF